MVRAIPNSGTNNIWYEYQGASSTLIFVHGVLSDSASCWFNKDNKAYWPELTLTDPRLPKLNVFLGGYYTAIDSGEYDVHNCAEELFSALKRVDLSGRPGPFDSPHLVFVCHSLGGIMAPLNFD
jgi:hypothetical protein